MQRWLGWGGRAREQVWIRPSRMPSSGDDLHFHGDITFRGWDEGIWLAGERAENWKGKKGRLYSPKDGL